MKDVRMFGPADNFTPAQYEEYQAIPPWALDSPDITTKSDYHGHWASTIINWVSQAKGDQSRWKSICASAIKDIENVQEANSARAASPQKSVAMRPMDLAYAHVHEVSSLLSINPPIGQCIASQESENQEVSALNELISNEFEANNFETLLFDAIYETEFYNLSWIKTGVERDAYGLFGQKGRIWIEKIDCDEIHVDPKAKRLRWDSMAFIIHETKQEMADIRSAYPISGFDISDGAGVSNYTSLMDQRADDTISSPIPKMSSGGPTTSRQDTKVFECWFKDSRKKFVARTEEKEKLDEFGEPYLDLKSPLIDQDGYVIGDWVSAYPRGRCIVLSEQHVLEDMANRLPHGQCPFTPVLVSPAKRPYIPGDAVRIIAICEKINSIMSEVTSYLLSEIPRPFQCEMGSFFNPQHYKKIPNRPDTTLIHNQGKLGTSGRREAVDIPQSTWTAVSEFKGFLDMVAGSSAVMRGTISDGAQLSSEALQSLQTFASSRVARKAKYIAKAVKGVTFQVQWLVRGTYDENIKVQVTLPDGSTGTIDWNSDRAVFEAGDMTEIDELISRESWIIGIKAGTGTPNAEQARQSVADHLYDRKAIDRPALLDAYQYGDRQEINRRMDQAEKDAIKAEAFGRKVGMKIVETEKQDGPGRKDKF